MIYKVFYCDDLHTDPPIRGTSDMVTVADWYVKVSGSLIFKTGVFLDTPENYAKVVAFQAEYKVWQALQPNVFQLLNSLEKV